MATRRSSAFGNLRSLLTDHAALSLRERAVLVCATAANVNDAYCSLAWGTTLASKRIPIRLRPFCGVSQRPR
jgi:hypothetical protein